MSCLSRLVGLICALLPGLLFLAFSARFFFLWPRLGFVVGPLYSFVSLVTGAICLYLGLSLLFDAHAREENATAVDEMPQVANNILAAPELAPEPVAAPMPVAASEPVAMSEQPALQSVHSAPSIFAQNQDTSDAIALNSTAPAASAPVDTPEARIRRLAATRPNWRVTAPQLAQLANLNMGVADATAREMARNGDAQIQTGSQGETVYLFNLAGENS